MNPPRWTRVGPIAGVVSVVLTAISFVMTSSDMPDFMDDPDKITSYYTDDPGKLMGGFMIDALGTTLLVVFAAAVYVRLGGVPRGLLPPAAFGGAIAMCAMFMVYDAVQLAAAARVEEGGSISAEEATTLNDLSFTALGMGATMFASLFVACTALSALGSGVLPRWLSYVSFLLALGLLIVPISYVFLPILLLWVLVVSVLMWMDREPAATTPA